MNDYPRTDPSNDPTTRLPEDTVDETPTSPADGPDAAAVGLLAEGRHPVHVTHLVMGVAFLCVAAAWGLVSAGLVQGAEARWLLPVPWLVAGAAGVTASVVAARRRRPAA